MNRARNTRTPIITATMALALGLSVPTPATVIATQAFPVGFEFASVHDGDTVVRDDVSLVVRGMVDPLESVVSGIEPVAKGAALFVPVTVIGPELAPVSVPAPASENTFVTAVFVLSGELFPSCDLAWLAVDDCKSIVVVGRGLLTVVLVGRGLFVVDVSGTSAELLLVFVV